MSRESIAKAYSRRNAVEAVKAFIKGNPELKGQALIINVMSRMDVSRHVARDYIIIALAEMGMPLDEIPAWLGRFKQMKEQEAQLRKDRGDVKEVKEE